MRHMAKYLPALLLPGLLLLAGPAHAETLGGAADRIAGQMSSLSKFISIVSFVLGLGIGMSGILKLKSHSQNPAQVPLNQPLMRILVASGLIALPTVMGNGIETLFGDGHKALNATDGIVSIDN